MQKPSFEIHRDTEKLVNFLASARSATYAEMSAHTGREIDGKDRYVLTSARRKLEKRGIFFGTRRGVGLERANNGQVADLSTNVPIKKIRRVTGKAQKRQAHVDIQQLSAEDRLAFNIGRSILGLVRQAASRSMRTRLKKDAENGPVDMRTILALPRHRDKDRI